MDERNDNELLREYALRNSEPAFDALVSRHINLVYSAALRHVGNPHQAEEITQAVFIILAKKSRSLGPKMVLSGWLYQATRLTAANFRKGEIRRQRREQEAHMQSVLNETEIDAWAQIAPALDDAMAGLGEKDRNAVVLRFFENKNLRDVGSELGVSEDAAKMRVTRAVGKLRKFFVKRGVVLSAVAIAGAMAANSVQAAPLGLVVTVAATAAKGAAVSGSTLTIVKGALKLMAWTKAKTAIVTSTAIMLATISTLTVARHFRHTHPPQTGRLKLPTGNITPMVGYGYSRYAIFLASDGSLWSWGEARLGWPVLGLENTNIQNTAALRRIGHETDWVNIAVGDSHCLAIKSDGTLWAWGKNINYQLGDGTKITRPTPGAFVPENDWKQAAAGGAHSLALKSDGTLWAWGNNWAGQLGTGGTHESTKPTQVGMSTNWIKIWAGGIQTVGLQSDGSLWFWGSLTGDAEATNNLLAPTRISPDTNWVDVCFGYFTVLALKSDGTLWSWGRGAPFYAQAKDLGPSPTPLQVGTENDWQSCASSPGGFYHVLMKKDGSLWALDASEHRQVNPDSEYKPVKRRKIDLYKDVVAFTGGGDDIGVVLTRDGEVWTWGKVIGEHALGDYWESVGEQLSPESKTIDKPWQVSNVDSSN